MAVQPRHELTALLKAWRRGDHAALDALLPQVYAELHRLAHFYMARERPGHILQTGALVNEMYVRLLDAQTLDWQDRAHFFGVCARLMRQVLVEHARARRARKRSGAAVRVEFDSDAVAAPGCDASLIALDEALSALAELDPREARIVEMRFFAGLSEEETAHALGISGRTVRRDWDHARSWLLRELQRGTSA